MPNASRDIAAKRDEAIMYVLKRHPATAKMLVMLRIFKTLKRARRRMSRLVERGKVSVVGIVVLPGHTGHPEYLYSVGRVAANKIPHEAELSQLLFSFHADQVRRGAECGRERADAEIHIGGTFYFVELDRDTHNLADTRKRVQTFRGSPYPVLWVAPSETRIKELMRISDEEGLAENCLFAMFDDAQRPHEKVWRYSDGKMTDIPQGNNRG